MPAGSVDTTGKRLNLSAVAVRLRQDRFYGGRLWRIVAPGEPKAAAAANREVTN